MNGYLIKRLATGAALAAALSLPHSYAQDHFEVVVYVHDDVPSNIATAPEGYFEPWQAEMAKIQPFPVRVEYRRNVPGVTDVQYQFHESQHALDNFRNALRLHNDTHKNWGHPKRTKRLLLTGGNINEDTLGIAYVQGSIGIATTTAFAAPGHELGHILGATHEASEVLNNPWFCETYMIPSRFSLRSNCYRYSDENRARISDYIHSLF